MSVPPDEVRRRLREVPADTEVVAYGRGPSVGAAFEHLTGQDSVAFTGSADTAVALRGHPVVRTESVAFNAEADSLNASVLGLAAAPGTPEFDLCVIPEGALDVKSVPRRGTPFPPPSAAVVR